MSVFVTRPRDDLVSVDTTAMLGWWLFDEGTGDAIHDRTGNGATILRGGTSPTATNRPTWVPPRGLQFDGTSDVAAAPASVTGAICATSRPVVEMVLTQPPMDIVWTLFCIGNSISSGYHFFMRGEGSRILVRGSNAAIVTIAPNHGVWPGTGKPLYLLCAHTPRAMLIRSANGAVGVFGETSLSSTTSVPLIIAAESPTGAGYAATTFRHLAVYDGNNPRCNTQAALTAMADTQYARFRAIGLLD